MSLTPEIMIAGIPIIEQEFEWAFTAGPEPYRTSFVIPNAWSVTMSQRSNPVDIEIKMYGGVGSPNIKQQTSYIIQDCWLLEPQPLDHNHTKWTIADNRFRLRGSTITCSYNKTRQKNSFTSGINPVIGTPSELRQDFDVFGAGRYIPWSINQENPEAPRPWTMHEILMKEIKNLGIDVLDHPDEQSYYLENIEVNAENAYSALKRLCEMSRHEISINSEGKIYVYNIDYYDKAILNSIYDMQTKKRLDREVAYEQDKKRVRPKNIHIYFEQKEEVWVTSSDSKVSSDSKTEQPLPITAKSGVWDDDDILLRKVIGCENVIRIPYPMTIGGKEYKVGEWIPMWRFLKEIDITEEQLRNYWFAGSIERLYCEKVHLKNPPRDEKNEVIARNIMAAVKQHYRQTFQIDPYHMDRIENWDARRVGIVDNYSHFSPPSPLFADYTVIPAARQTATAKRTAGWDKKVYVWNVNERDAGRQNATAGTIVMVSQPLGIFRISYPSTMYSTLVDIIPFGFDTVPNSGVPNPILGTPLGLLESCKMKESFEMQTIISILRSVSGETGTYTRLKFFHVGFENLGGTGPDIEYLSKSEYARFQIKEYDYSQWAENTTVKNDGILPVNYDLVVSLARSEASMLLHNYDNFPSGGCKLGGLVEIPLHANILSVILSISPSHGLTTSIRFKAVPGFSLEQKTNQEEINFLHKHVSRGGDKNLSQGSGY